MSDSIVVRMTTHFAAAHVVAGGYEGRTWRCCLIGAEEYEIQ